ncbi:MAG TPA: DUF445 domain-containing protein [Gammaproteobacteria bacterium]
MTDAERELRERLRRMKLVATGLLVAMAGLYVVTSLALARYPALGWVRAFAEAAMIGGLADWFAVTALFRRPLGLPIPHTAIVPTRKDEIGRALARFVRDHFLVREAIERRLARVDLASRIGAWLDQEATAARLARDTSRALDWSMQAVDSAELRTAVKDSLREALDQAPLHVALALLVDVLRSENHAQALIDQLVQFGRDQLDAHRDDIRRRIGERSPWWLPKFVDEHIYDQLVGEFERILNEIGTNPEHPARVGLNERLETLRRGLAEDPALIEKARALQHEFLEHPTVHAYVRDLWDRIRAYLHESFTSPQSTLRTGLEREIRSIGRSIAADPEVGARLNHWLKEGLIYLVENYRNSLSEIISETVAHWDPKATAARVELHIGSDLQYIRVNGTLVGGLVGVLIYAGSRALALS